MRRSASYHTTRVIPPVKPLCTDVRCDLPADHTGGCKSFEDEDFDEDEVEEDEE